MLIKEEFGLTLFGFDVIILSESQRFNSISSDKHNNSSGIVNSISVNSNSVGLDDQLVVIDVNYFPSYKEVGDFPLRLRQFLGKKAYLCNLNS